MFRFLSSALLLVSIPASLIAGMPSPRVMEIPRMRLDSLSFFLMGFFVTALIFQGIWNVLRRDVPALPRLSYPKSVGMIMVWAALFGVVLTMISGARELLTPGAWEKVGSTYQLKDHDYNVILEPPEERIRRAGIEKLRGALWAYAAGHEGNLPPGQENSAIGDEFWTSPDPSRAKYAYVAGNKVHAGVRLIAFEPLLYSDNHLSLFANGEIKILTTQQLESAIRESQ